MRNLVPTIARDAFSYRSDPSVPPFPDDHTLILFDGHCGLCSRMVQFTLRLDTAGTIRFMPAQTALGDALYAHFGLDSDAYETFILLRDGKGYFASDAGIELLRSLPFPWSLAPILRIIPKIVRDWVYLRIAHNRLRFFGRTGTCYVPSPEQAARFVDGGQRIARGRVDEPSTSAAGSQAEFN